MTADAQQSDAGKQDAPSESSATEASAPAFELIDDMEANSGQVALTNGRNGFWFTYGDGTDGGVETPGSGLPFTDSMNSPPRAVPASFVSFTGAESNYAAQTSGSGFAMFAGMGVNFKNPPAFWRRRRILRTPSVGRRRWHGNRPRYDPVDHPPCLSPWWRALSADILAKRGRKSLLSNSSA
jgi:hypothetical protein